jgi:mycothiol synthase
MRVRQMLNHQKGAQMPEPRPYAEAQDREAMRQLLVQGRQADNGSYYIHIGDLNWWLYYINAAHNPWQHIYLWEGRHTGDVLRGWALLSPQGGAFDVFVHPRLRGSLPAWQMYTWAEERAAAILRSHGKDELRTIWVSSADDLLIGHLERRGFSRSPHYTYQYRRRLEGPVPVPELPEGYHVRRMAGERELNTRAAASQSAFASPMDAEGYRRRYLGFMRSPVYRPELDIVAIAPDGNIASFCNGWLDFSNRVGLFEPVGTHPDYQRLGLGRAVLAEGMRRMMAYGMRDVIVCAESGNMPAQGLYQRAGFQPERRLLTYTKPLTSRKSGRSGE